MTYFNKKTETTGEKLLASTWTLLCPGCNPKAQATDQRQCTALCAGVRGGVKARRTAGDTDTLRGRAPRGQVLILAVTTHCFIG